MATRSRRRPASSASARPTGISLPNEAIGRVPDAQWKQQIHNDNPAAFPYPDWLPGDNIQSAIGQGDVLVTPIQLASAYATFANGGTRLLAAARRRGLRRARPQDPRPARRSTSVTSRSRSARRVLAGLTGVVEYAEGHGGRGVRRASPRASPRARPAPRRCEGKQNTSWFVGHDARGGAEVRGARGGRGGRVRRADRGADRPRGDGAAERPAGESGRQRRTADGELSDGIGLDHRHRPPGAVPRVAAAPRRPAALRRAARARGPRPADGLLVDAPQAAGGGARPVRLREAPGGRDRRRHRRDGRC